MLPILVLNLGKAVGFYFGRFGPNFGQGFGPLLWPFLAHLGNFGNFGQI